MVTFSSQSAQAKCHRSAWSGLLHIHYSGVITNGSMSVIGPQIVGHAANDAVAIYWSQAVTPWPYEININRNVCLAGSGVFIVRKDQLEGALNHAALLAKFGILRTVFLDSQLDLALVIAESLAIRQRSSAIVASARLIAYSPVLGHA